VGTGVAVGLLEAAVDGLREAGAEEAFLRVGEASLRARRFHEREGWVHDGAWGPSSSDPTELRYRLTLSSHSRSA
jgi:hypothetical protein